MNKLISTVKENLAILTIVPALIGWFLQILFLWNIGIPYIRFFSPSQVISDWLLILWAWLAIYSGFITANLFFKHIINKSLDSKEPVVNIKFKSSKTIWKNIIYGRLALVFFTLFFCSYLIYKLYKVIPTSEFTIFNLFIFPFIFSFILELTSSVVWDFLDLFWFQKCIIDNTPSKTVVKYIITHIMWIIIFFFLITGLFSIFTTVYKAFFFPTNLSNSVNLNKYSENEIIYFNDKYIFIKNKTDSQVTVKKFDDIFQK